MGFEAKDGRIRITNAAGVEVFNTDHDHAFFIREVTGTITLPARTNVNNVPDQIPDSNHLIVSDLPSSVTWVQGMVRNTNPNFTTDWLCFGGSIALEFFHDSATPYRLAVASMRLAVPQFWVDVRYLLRPGYSVASSSVDYYFIFGGFN